MWINYITNWLNEMNANSEFIQVFVLNHKYTEGVHFR